MKSIPLILATLLVSSVAQAGVWNVGSFENDDALDWVSECTQSSSITPVTRAFETVLQAEYIEAPDGAIAIAAAEAVAAAVGKPSESLPAELRVWIERQPREKLAQLAPTARKALTRILDPKVSELQQLWSEGDNRKWTAAVTELAARLGAR